MLDTNAWLDLVVFNDPALRGLDDTIRAGHVRVATDTRAMDELSRILGSSKLALDRTTAEPCMQRVRELSTLVEVTAPPLPRCRDVDDQMFLEIAASVGASWLMTRDAELLRMSRRMTRDHGVAIVTPDDWRRACRPQISKR